jgi:hypothetical protein
LVQKSEDPNQPIWQPSSQHPPTNPTNEQLSTHPPNIRIDYGIPDKHDFAVWQGFFDKWKQIIHK